MFLGAVKLTFMSTVSPGFTSLPIYIISYPKTAPFEKASLVSCGHASGPSFLKVQIFEKLIPVSTV